jgi:hypothetical protein
LGAPQARPDWAARAALTASRGPGLAPPAAVLAVGAAGLDDPDAGRGDVPRQSGAVAAGPFDPDQADRPEPAQPAEQAGVAGRGGREFTTWRACPARSASSLWCGCSGISSNLFADASEKLVGTRARADRSYPSYLRKAPLPVRLTLLGVALEAALGNRRFAGGSADPADPEGRYSAGQRVDRDLRRVRGMEGILLRLAAAAVEQPDELVRTALYRVAARKRCGELCHAGGPGMRSPGPPARACAAPSGELCALAG